MSNTVYYNKTGTSKSIPKKLLRSGRFDLLLLYYLLLPSFLGKEAVKNQGSYRFADHIYEYKASGDNLWGTIVDYIFLRFPSARAFRTRYTFSVQQLTAQIPNLLAKQKSVTVLSIPAGIPRVCVEAAATLTKDQLKRTSFICFDLDPKALEIAQNYVEKHNLQDSFSYIQADIFQTKKYPNNVDIVTCHGLGEFLTDAQLTQFYGIVQSVLSKDGAFYTSGLKKHRVSDYLLSNLTELYSNYRTEEQLREMLQQTGFSTITIEHDKTGLQSLVTAKK